MYMLMSHSFYVFYYVLIVKFNYLLYNYNKFSRFI